MYELMGIRVKLGVILDRQWVSLMVMRAMIFAREELADEELSIRTFSAAQAQRLPDASCPQNELLRSSGMTTRKCWSAPDLVSLDARTIVFR
jgi:hypothetical protein